MNRQWQALARTVCGVVLAMAAACTPNSQTWTCATAADCPADAQDSAPQDAAARDATAHDAPGPDAYRTDGAGTDQHGAADATLPGDSGTSDGTSRDGARAEAGSGVDSWIVRTDLDGDGAEASADCNDRDPERAPGLSEVCDQKDNDCDGQLDEGCCPIGMRMARALNGLQLTCVSTVQGPATVAQARSGCLAMGGCIGTPPVDNSACGMLFDTANGAHMGCYTPTDYAFGTSIGCTDAGSAYTDCACASALNKGCVQRYYCTASPALPTAHLCSNNSGCGPAGRCTAGHCEPVAPASGAACCAQDDCPASSCQFTGVASPGRCGP